MIPVSLSQALPSLPAAAALGALLAWLAARGGARAIRMAIDLALVLLLPSIAFLLAPGLWHAVAPGAGSTAPSWPRAGRTLCVLPVLMLPVLMLPVLRVLSRMPPGQARAAAGLGAGRAARLRLLWLPLLAPASLLGLSLAALLVLAGLSWRVA